MTNDRTSAAFDPAPRWDPDFCEDMLFGHTLPQSWEGRWHIGVRCRDEDRSCVLTVWHAEGCRWKARLRCDGMIGKNGSGKLVEGDARTPCGTFRLRGAYGILPDPGSRLPYLQVTDDMYWRADGTCGDYNTLGYASRLGPHADLSNDEHLADYGADNGGLYNYFIDIGYDAEGLPYAGSAVFLHCWRAKGSPTGGCVAVLQDDMLRILRMVEPGALITIY